jgi:hypothetical protein
MHTSSPPKVQYTSLKLSTEGRSKQLAISQSPGSSRENPMLEGHEIWQHTFKLKV